MIIINKANLEKHGRTLQGHEAFERAARMEHNARQEAMIANMAQGIDHAVNARQVYDNDYWLEIDRTTREIADDTRGREIFDDLQAVATVLPLGKTVRAYTNVGDIAEDVQITMDGQAPFTFDQTGYAGDGDPIPMFTAGFGVNYRHLLGANDAGLDLMLDSQRAKLRKFYGTMNRYMLNGDVKISEAGFAGQGIKTHRNTCKIDLKVSGAAGAPIDLTTAGADDVVGFFTGVFSAQLDANNIGALDVLFVSKEIRANLSKPFSASTGFKDGTIEDHVLRYNPRIKEIRTAYSLDTMGDTGLSGNEFLGYVRSKQFIEIPTGQAVVIVPLPRIMPRANFNNDISSAFGVQVKKDRGNCGVFYAADLT